MACAQRGIRVGEDFEGALGFRHGLSAMGVLYDGNVGASLVGQQVVHVCGDIVRRSCPAQHERPAPMVGISQDFHRPHPTAMG